MWSLRHQGEWKDLDAIYDPKPTGRALPVGGFVFVDPFENFLRNLSEDYLQKAWERLKEVLRLYQLDIPPDLTWGALHPGEIYINRRSLMAPHAYIGWSSETLYNLVEEDFYLGLDRELVRETPMLQCGSTWRSHKWQIAPDNYSLALRLIEALCLDELSEGWS